VTVKLFAFCPNAPASNDTAASRMPVVIAVHINVLAPETGMW